LSWPQNVTEALLDVEEIVFLRMPELLVENPLEVNFKPMLLKLLTRDMLDLDII
jgi:hypothetical protein